MGREHDASATRRALTRVTSRQDPRGPRASLQRGFYRDIKRLRDDDYCESVRSADFPVSLCQFPFTFSWDHSLCGEAFTQDALASAPAGRRPRAGVTLA